MTLTRKYEAIIFDMDGVLADSEPVYFVSINTVLAPHRRQISATQNASLTGRSMNECVQAVIEMTGLDVPLEELVEVYTRDLLKRLPLLAQPLPGVIAMIERVKRASVPLALASSSDTSLIEALLGGIDLRGQFDITVSGSMVENAKPAPDIYLLAAKRLGLPSSACIAIEDSPAGLASARAAGMFSVQVRSASTAFPPQADADLVLDSLEDFDFGLIGLR